jgi:hypothetical protein
MKLIPGDCSLCAKGMATNGERAPWDPLGAVSLAADEDKLEEFVLVTAGKADLIQGRQDIRKTLGEKASGHPLESSPQTKPGDLS